MRLRWLLNPWRLARRLAYELHRRRHPDEPWLAGGAIAFLDRELPRDGTGLEWGSGSSTGWFAQRLGRLVSVEMDRGWFDVVRAQTAAMPNVDLRHVPLDHRPEEPTLPHYDPTPRYVGVVEEFGPETLDFVLVDGHYRQACVLAVLAKLRRGALLAVDNTDWLPDPEWGVPSDWPLVHRSANAVTETTVWRRPDA